MGSFKLSIMAVLFCGHAALYAPAEQLGNNQEEQEQGNRAHWQGLNLQTALMARARRRTHTALRTYPREDQIRMYAIFFQQTLRELTDEHAAQEAQRRAEAREDKENEPKQDGPDSPGGIR